MRASNLVKSGPRPKYGIITNETLDTLFDNRLLGADLLSRSGNVREHHAGWMVRETLLSLRKQLEELIQ